MAPCPAHPRHAWSRSNASEYGAEHRRLRSLLLPAGEVTPCALCSSGASILDHRIPLAEGGRTELSNMQPLCKACSDAKSQAEAKRGQMRAMRARREVVTIR